MNAYAMFLADEALRMTNDSQAILRAESRAELRTLRGPGRIARAATAVVHAVRVAVARSDNWTSTPRLADYPYRS